MAEEGPQPLLAEAAGTYNRRESIRGERGIVMALVEQIPAEVYLKTNKIPYDIEFHAASESALAEARELHMMPSDVLKAVLLKVGDRFAMAITPASRRLHMRRLKDVIGHDHVRLATEEEMRAAFPEYELGALPPLPGLLGVTGYLDPAVLEHYLVAFADGRRTESMISSPRRLFWGQPVFVAPVTWDPDRDLYFEGDSVDVKEWTE